MASLDFSCGSHEQLLSATYRPLESTGLAPEDYVPAMMAAMEGACS